VTELIAEVAINDIELEATCDVVIDSGGGGGGGVYEEKSVSYTPTESQQTDAVTPGSSYDALSKVNITIGAIPSTYVGSGIDRRDSTDLSASGATVSVPAGYYASAASKAVATGTEGTPTATKGTVSNHSVSVTPSVTNVAGYIAGGTKTGTAVTVSASELVSGSETKTSNGTYDVTNLASLIVNVAASTPTLSTYHVCMGQYTPSSSGNFTIDVNVGETISSVKWGVIWLNDNSVVSNYSSSSIMLMSFSPVAGGYSTIDTMNGTNHQAQSKTAYGLEIKKQSAQVFRFNYRSYSQWMGQPETYNYIGIYSV